MKNPHTNPTPEAHIIEKKAVEAEAAVGNIGVFSKPPLAPKVMDLDKTKTTPLVVTKGEPTSLPVMLQRRKIWPPSSYNYELGSPVRDEHGNHVPSGAYVFGDHALLARLNWVRVLPKDYGAYMKPDESQHIEMFERIRYPVCTCSFSLFTLRIRAFLTDYLSCSWGLWSSPNTMTVLPF